MSRVKANALLEKKRKAAEEELLRQEQEEQEEAKERNLLFKSNRRKGGISGQPHRIYHHLHSSRLSGYYNAYDEVDTYLENSHETANDIENSTETVIAQLVYDESKDELKSELDAIDNMAGDDTAETNKTDGPNGEKKKVERLNPVFAALDDAKNVDDMFRIAEIWVNPMVYGIG